MTRPDFDTYFLNIARAVSLRATCPRASIGAVIVSEDNRILSTGYNGAPSGKPHCLEEGCLMSTDNHCQRGLHAEVNAIAYAARHGIRLEGSRLYMYGPRDVCRECRKVLIATGIEVWILSGGDCRNCGLPMSNHLNSRYHTCIRS